MRHYKGRSIPETTAELVDPRHAAYVLVDLQNDFCKRGGSSDETARLKFMMRAYGTSDPTQLPEYTLEGTWGHEIIPEVAPLPGEFVIKKHTSSSFAGTRIAHLLRMNGVRTVVLVGGVTEGWLESAARDARHHGYFVVLCEEAVASFNPELYEASLKVMRRRYEVMPAADVLGVWDSLRQPAHATSGRTPDTPGSRRAESR